MRAADLSILVVFDNYPHREGLETSWGFACVVRGAEKTILFDTGGDGDMLMRNMQRLGVDPESIEVVVLSHIHWDHTGGLTSLLAANPHVTVHLPRSFSEKLKSEVAATGAGIVEVHEPARICESVHTTGEMGTDPIEQSLVLRTDAGLVLITGCAHPGIVPITERAGALFENEEVLLAMGGFHLRSDPRPHDTVADLRRLGVRLAGPTHCSGDQTREVFRTGYGPNYVEVGVGALIKDLALTRS